MPCVVLFYYLDFHKAFRHIYVFLYIPLVLDCIVSSIADFTWTKTVNF